MTGARAAILLAGGRASRLGGIDKNALEVDGRTLLEHAVAAAASVGCTPIVVAGPERPGTDGVVWVREDPPFGGPVAGIAAALGALDPADGPWTVVLSCDLPGAAAALTRVVRDLVLLGDDVDAVCLGDASSRPQWLVGAYRTAALRRAIAALPRGGRDAAVRDFVAELAVVVLAAPDAETADVDTWEDLEQARSRAAAARRPAVPGETAVTTEATEGERP